MVRDRDVEVNFGPSKEHVTWHGTFHDASGTPIPDGAIEVFPAGMKFMDTVMYSLWREMKTDREGRFETRKLLPGEYRLK